MSFMGEIRGVITSKSEKAFRKLAMKKYGYRKGSLSKALEDAILRWIEFSELEVEKPA